MILVLRIGGTTSGFFAGRDVGQVMLERFTGTISTFKKIPLPVLGVAVMVGFYGVLNFVMSMGRLSGGVPVEVNGEPALMNHGVFVRLLSLAEFRRLQASRFGSLRDSPESPRRSTLFEARGAHLHLAALGQSGQ